MPTTAGFVRPVHAGGPVVWDVVPSTTRDGSQGPIHDAIPTGHGEPRSGPKAPMDYAMCPMGRPRCRKRIRVCRMFVSQTPLDGRRKWPTTFTTTTTQATAATPIVLLLVVVVS
jgi:hypothetical protein